jgi:AcrR family transcriptional regulator
MNREKPKQARSTLTVDLISEATIQVLDGHDAKFTTNHIADRSGFSVGTLYRYFPDKGAILRSVARRGKERTSKRALEVIETSQHSDAEALIQDVIEVSMALFSGRSRATHRMRELLQSDEVMVAEMAQARLMIMRRLHDRLMEIEPDRFVPISDENLDAASESYKAVLLTLGRRNSDNVVSSQTRSKLVVAFLDAMSSG